MPLDVYDKIRQSFIPCDKYPNDKEDRPMADFLVSNSMLMLEKAMNFQWTKQSVILNNVTNADTPDFKPEYILNWDTRQRLYFCC